MSTPSRLDILNTLPALETVPAAAAPRGLVIGVGSLRGPKYPDRPQIVTRAGRNQSTLSELDRWAEPRQDNVSGVRAENLTFPIPTEQSLLQPWARSAALDYQVPFAFAGTLNKLTIAIDRPKLTPEHEKCLREGSQRD